LSQKLQSVLTAKARTTTLIALPKSARSIIQITSLIESQQVHVGKDYQQEKHLISEIQ